MMGRASEIKIELLVETLASSIDDEITSWLEDNEDAEVIDIKFSIMQNGENINEVYREALIIYKQS